MKRVGGFAFSLLTLALVFSLCVPAFAETSVVFENVDTSDYPTVSMVLRLPSELVGDTDAAISVWENSVEMEGVDVQPLAQDQGPVDVVLLLDGSGSMQGAPLTNARRAAQQFVQSMRPIDRIAIVAFDSTTRVVVPFTSDKTELASAIGGLKATGETALYDGIVRASDLLANAESDSRYLVLLSDGGDTVSATSLDNAVTSVSDASASVYAVALTSPEYDAKPLKTLTKASGGTLVSAKNAESLTSVFSGIAEELRNAYVAKYTSTKPNTKDLEIRVVAQSGSQSAEAVKVIANPLFDASAGPATEPVPVVDTALFVLTLTSVSAMMFVAVTAFVWALLSYFQRRRGPLDSLGYYDQMKQSGDPDEAAQAPSGDVTKVRVLDVVDRIATPRGYTQSIKQLLERAGLPLRPLEFMYFHFVGVLIVGFITLIVSGRLLLVALMVAITAIVPTMVLNLLVARRKRKFEDQLPDILDLMAGSLRAGWGLQQSIELVVQQATDPVQTEFARVQAQVRLGMSLESALDAAANRLDSEDFHWTVTAITIQREVGGNLAEVLGIVASTIRERGELKRHVAALTAEGRFSAIVLTALPFILMFLMFIVSPRYISNITSSILGWGMMGFGGVLLLIGVVWLNRTMKVEV